MKRPVGLQLARSSTETKLFLKESLPCLQGFFGMAFSTVYEVVRSAKMTCTSLSSWGRKQTNHVFSDTEKKLLLAQRG